MKPIRVMIVEDSRVVCEMLAHLIDCDPRLQVAAVFATAEQALRSLASVAPDVISMDIRLPGIDGVEATRQIMETRPTPIVIVSRSVSSVQCNAAIEAMSAGALAVVEKPAGFSHREFAAIAERLCSQLAAMSQVKLVRQRFNRRVHTQFPDGVPPFSLAAESSVLKPPRDLAQAYRLLGVVASTGGPHALEVLFSRLGADFPLPIVLVQHITAAFQSSFIAWLDQICPWPVCEAREGVAIEPAHVYVAPMNRHLLVTPTRLCLADGEPIDGHCPSGTVLFRSLAESFGPRGMGVLLTGMGGDGAAGLFAMKQAGGYTIAEDESTAVVNGMPEVARQMGAQCISLPLPIIAGAIRQLTMPSPKPKKEAKK